MPVTPEQLTTLERFALDHEVALVKASEVGFGRPCVGFTHGNGLIDTRPLDTQTYDVLDGFDDRICDMAPENAYHKHDCLAVLVHDNDYDAALHELYLWVEQMNKVGVEIVRFTKQPQSVLQAMLTGIEGRAVRVAGEVSAKELDARNE